METLMQIHRNRRETSTERTTHLFPSTLQYLYISIFCCYSFMALYTQVAPLIIFSHLHDTKIKKNTAKFIGHILKVLFFSFFLWLQILVNLTA